MSSKRVETVLLCEDVQHEAFLRRLSERIAPGGARPRVEKSPSGRGSAERWVIERFPRELQALRSIRKAARIVVMLDGDGRSPVDRRAELAEACRAEGVNPPAEDDPILVLVPCRNIETWLTYLQGETVDEARDHPKLPRARECRDQVRVLAEMCERRELRQPAPPSLEAACLDYQRQRARR